MSISGHKRLTVAVLRGRAGIYCPDVTRTVPPAIESLLRHSLGEPRLDPFDT